MNNQWYVDLVFETQHHLESLALDSNVEGFLPYNTLYEAILDYGGSVIGTAFQKHMLMFLQRKYPNDGWVEGKKDQPDLYNTTYPEKSFELKTTTSGRILGNKTSNTTTKKVDKRFYLLVYIDKIDGAIDKIAVADLSSTDWQRDNQTNIQFATIDESKINILYPKQKGL